MVSKLRHPWHAGRVTWRILYFLCDLIKFNTYFRSRTSSFSTLVFWGASWFFSKESLTKNLLLQIWAFKLPVSSLSSNLVLNSSYSFWNKETKFTVLFFTYSKQNEIPIDLVAHKLSISWCLTTNLSINNLYYYYSSINKTPILRNFQSKSKYKLSLWKLIPFNYRFIVLSLL